MTLAWPIMKELSEIRDRLNEIIDATSLETGSLNSKLSGTPFCPAADLYETAEHVVVIVEVPGVDPGSIDLQLQETRLRVSGSFVGPRDSSNERFVMVERPQGSFYRDFELPEVVGDEQPIAELERGVLTVLLKKPSQGSQRRITVSEGRSS